MGSTTNCIGTDAPRRVESRPKSSAQGGRDGPPRRTGLQVARGELAQISRQEPEGSPGSPGFPTRAQKAPGSPDFPTGAQKVAQVGFIAACADSECGRSGADAIPTLRTSLNGLGLWVGLAAPDVQGKRRKLGIL